MVNLVKGRGFILYNDFFKLGIGGKPWLYMKKYTKIMPKNVNTIEYIEVAVCRLGNV